LKGGFNALSKDFGELSDKIELNEWMNELKRFLFLSKKWTLNKFHIVQI
jgi:hypothetical protein